jgi:hypothetical protein
LHGAREEVLLTMDVGSEDGPSRVICTVNIGHQRLPDSLWSLEKHVVQTQLIAGRGVTL